MSPTARLFPLSTSHVLQSLLNGICNPLLPSSLGMYSSASGSQLAKGSAEHEPSQHLSKRPEPPPMYSTLVASYDPSFTGLIATIDREHLGSLGNSLVDCHVPVPRFLWHATIVFQPDEPRGLPSQSLKGKTPELPPRVQRPICSHDWQMFDGSWTSRRTSHGRLDYN